MPDYPDRHLRYMLVSRVVREKEVWRNREDAHGGPGYEKDWEVVVEKESTVTPKDLPRVVGRVARGEVQ